MGVGVKTSEGRGRRRGSGESSRPDETLQRTEDTRSGVIPEGSLFPGPDVVLVGGQPTDTVGHDTGTRVARGRLCSTRDGNGEGDHDDTRHTTHVPMSHPLTHIHSQSEWNPDPFS